MKSNPIHRWLVIGGAVMALACGAAQAQNATSPNILVIMADDTGWSNVSRYGNGVMGYQTPNIDSIGRDGVTFTDHYAQPSCTAGRAAFITGQYPIRSGLTTVGSPGNKLGIQPATPTLAELLKERGYTTGQFGKNHLGDRNEHLPTVHGFDEFFGNLYHLNSEELPEQADYPQDPGYRGRFGPRGVLKCVASATDDPTVDPRFGAMGKQRCTDTGPLTRKRMETVDGEFIDAALDFAKRSQAQSKPFFVWLNPTRMHMYTHLRPEHRNLATAITSEDDLHGSGMMEHDMDVGRVLDGLKKAGMLDNTIVIYTADNGPEHSARFHGGTTPFRGEKMTTYEGGMRVPTLVRWPGHIPAGRTLSGIQSHMDLFTTLAAAAGVPDAKEKIQRERNQFIDGVNNLDYWMGKRNTSARDSFIYYYESEITAVRWRQWKLHFATKENYYAPLVKQSMPLIFNLRSDPFESYDEVADRSHMMQSKQWLEGPLMTVLGPHAVSLAKFPPVQKGLTLDINRMMQAVRTGQ